jgi:hypothetical protein
MSKQSFGHPNPLEDARRVQTLGALPTNSNGSGAPADASYVTISSETGLSNERALDVDSPLTLEDGGANAAVTLGLDADALEDTLDDTYLRLDTTNDPLTGPLDIVTVDEHALRVLAGAGSGGATEVWALAAGKIVHAHVPIGAAAWVWSRVDSPTAGNTSPSDGSVPALDNARIQIDGTVLYTHHYNAYGRTAIYKTTTHNGTVSWSLVIASDVPRDMPDGYHTGYVEGLEVIDNTLLVYAYSSDHPSILRWVGISSDAGVTFTWVPKQNFPHAPDSYVTSAGIIAYYYTLNHYANSGGLITLAPFYNSIYTGWALRPFLRGSSYDFLLGHSHGDSPDFAVNIERIQQMSDRATAYSRTDPAIGNGQITQYLYSSYGARSTALPNVYYFDVLGALHVWDGAERTVAVPPPLGMIRDRSYWGGAYPIHGRLTFTRDGARLFSGSADGAETWSAIDGNLFSDNVLQLVNNDTQSLAALDLVFGNGPSDVAHEVFDVDSIAFTTTVIGTLELIGKETITDQIVSTLATGTAPLDVDSTTLNANLNADLLDGQHASEFAPAASAHNPVTLNADADTILALSTQQIGLDTQTANCVLAGPTTGAAAVPTFRALVAADIPALPAGSITPSQLENGTAANQLLITGATPFAFARSVGTLNLGAYNVTIPASGTAAIGAGTLTASTPNDVTGATHTHAITSTVIGAASTIAATDSNGGTQFQYLGVGSGAVDTNRTINTLRTGVNATSTTQYGIRDYIYLDTVGGSEVVALESSLVIRGAGSQSASLYGTLSSVVNTGATLNTAAYGGLYQIDNQSGDLVVGYGFRSQVINRSAGVIQYAYGSLSSISNLGAGDIYWAYGSYITNPAKPSGIIYNYWGLYIEALTSANSNYAIYSAGGQSYHAGNLGLGLATTPTTLLHGVTPGDTSGIKAMLTLDAARTGAGANADGGSIVLTGKSSTTDATTMGEIKWLWINATHASRTAKLQLTAYDTAERVGLEVAADGALPTVNILGATVGNEAGDTTTDLRWETDTEANALLVDASADKVYIGGTTNGIEISKGGTLKAIGTATWFDDLRVEPTVRSTGSKAPSYTNYQAGGSASGLYFYLFDNAIAANEKEVNFKLQMPHGKLLASAIHLHIHWVPTSTGSAGDKVRWGLEYTKANPNGTFGAVGAYIYATDPVSPPSTTPTAHTHYITEFADIDMTGDALSTIILCRLFRNSSNAADSFAGDVGLLYIDAHVEYSQLGSNEEYTQ